MAAADYYTQVYTMFVGYYGRPPAQSGLEYYAGLVDKAGGNLAVVIDDFFKSAESQAFFAGKSVEQQVNQIFQNLFGRDALPAGLNYWANLINNGTVALSQAAYTIAFNAAAADVAVRDAKIASAKAWVAGLDTTAEILAFGTDGGRTAGRDFLKTVTTSTPATQTATDAALKAMVDGTTTNPGQTYTLTTGLDTVTGTAGNDVIRGDFTATATVNAGDTIDGGAGTDTLQLYGNFSAAAMPLSIKGVEVLQLASAQPDLAIDLTTFSKAATGIESVVLSNVAALSGKTVTTTAGQQLTLATGASSVATAGAVTWAASATDTAATLTLAGYQGGSGVTPLAVTVTGAATKTTNLNSTTAKNGVSTLTLAATTETVNINASSELSVTTGLVAAAAKQVNVTGSGKVTIAGAATDLAATVTVDASAATGSVNFTDEAAGSVLTFKGGSGNDSVTFAATRLTTADTLTGGAGTDVLVINDTVLTSFYGAINAATDFEVLGLGTTAAAVSMSSLTKINSVANVSGGDLTVNNSKATTTVTINNTANSGTTTVNNAVGETAASVTVDYGTATVARTVTGVTLSGATNVSLVSTGTGVGGSNVITTLSNMDNSNITLTGAKDLTITNALAGTGTGSKFDANAFTGKLSLIGSTQADIIIGGTAADKLQGGAGNDSITSGTGNDIVLGGAGADTLAGGADIDTFVYVAKADTVTTANVDKITDFAAGTDKIGLTGTGVAGALLEGVTLTAATAAVSTLGAMLQNATSVASAADVYTQLAITLDATALAASAADGTATVARVVEFTTGAAAGKYLIINDASAAFQAANDIVINITGVTGTLAATDFAFSTNFFA